MDRLLIVGAGGFGREVLAWASELPSKGREWEIGGFLDQNPHALEDYSIDVPVLGDPLKFELADSDRLVLAVGDPTTKLELYGELKSRGARFATLVHPTAVVGPACELGEGCILCAWVVLTTNVRVGNVVHFNCFSGCGHDAIVGDGCTLGARADVTGGARLGRGVLLGTHACVAPGVTVGDRGSVGACSLALGSVAPGATALGVPARTVFQKG